MSENHDPEQALQSLGNGAEWVEGVVNINVGESSSQNDSVLQSSEVSTGFSSSESNRESTLSPVGTLTEGAKNSGKDGPDGTVVVEDAGKEDMFVDCPDELVGNVDSREVAAAAEIQGSLMEETPSDMQQELQYEVEKVSPMHEVENTRATLNKTIFERENVIHDFEEERETFVQEFLIICRQLKAATNQPLMLDFSGSHGIKHVEENNLGTNTTLKDLVNECSQLVNRTLDQRLQYEATIGELRNNLLVKDQEIEYLNAKVIEISVSDQVVRSYANSIEDSMKVSSEKERDMEATLDRVLTSLNSLLNQEHLLDDSISEKTLNVERSTSLLIDNYNRILLDINQLQKCLSGTESDIIVTDVGTILASAQDDLIRLKAKEVSNVEKIYHLEDENRRLAEELDNCRLRAETVNGELGKAKSELEQERMRCANTKEKLTMAVTKGKALVQKRNSLEQSLAEKVRELEKVSVELQEKSIALEAAELIKVDLAKNDTLVASLRENLLQRNTILESFEDIISQLDVPQELKSVDSMERLKWLVGEKKVLEAILLEFYKLKDAVNLSDWPDLIAPYDLKSSVSWLKEAFFQAKDEITILQDELAKTKEAAQAEIDRISALVLIRLQEKDYLQEQLDDLSNKYEEARIKEHENSLEKAQIIKMLQEESGVTTDNGGISETLLDLNLLVYKYIQRLKEQACASAEISGEYVESFEKVHTLLYISHQDLMLYDIILGEESSNLSNCQTRLRLISEEHRELKEENDSLQKDLQRSEEKYAMLREKLSLAVKKGKGLVQDRENMKSLLDDKNLEIEKLKLQLNSLESTVADFRSQINLLSIDTQRIPELESELGILNDKCNQYEQFLLESNNMLQKVIESIDGIVLPINIVFEEPVAKLKWISEYIRESHDAKTRTEQELENVKEESNAMESKLGDTLAAMKSLEDALSSAENNVFQLSKDKGEIESSKTQIEQELQKALDEAYSQSSMISAEASSSMSLLQESLSLAENKISVLVKEKEEAEVCKVTAETESKKVKEQVAVQTDRLAEAQGTINRLEKTLTELETNVALLTEQNAEAQSAIEKLEHERKVLQEEVSSQASKVVEAVETRKSLEDSLLKAENKISIIEGERKISENEIFALNSKLTACMEELAGSNGSLESRSVEFAGYLNDLHKFIADETLLTVVTGCFEKKLESLREMDIILKNTRNCLINSGIMDSHNHHAVMDLNGMESLSHGKLLDFDVESETRKAVVEDDVGNISSSFRKILEEIWLKNKKFTDYFEGFSSSMDGFVADLLKNVQATREEIVFVCGHVESLKEMVKNLEMHKQEQEITRVMLENDVSLLISVCVDTTKELQFEMTNHLLLLSPVPDFDNLKDAKLMESSETSGASAVESQVKSCSSKSAAAAEQLLTAIRKVRSMFEQFESTSKVAASRIQDMQHRLEISEATTEKVKAADTHDFNFTPVISYKPEINYQESVLNEPVPPQNAPVEPRREQSKPAVRHDSFSDWFSAELEPNFTSHLLAQWLAPGGEPCRDLKTTDIAISGMESPAIVTLSTGDVHEFRFQALDESGNPRCLGGDYFETDLSGNLWKSRPFVKDFGNGTYSFWLQVHPDFAGDYNLTVILLFRHFEGLRFSPTRFAYDRELRRIKVRFVKNSVVLPKIKMCRSSDFSRDIWTGRWTRHGRNDRCKISDDGRYRCFAPDYPCQSPWCNGPLGLLESNGWVYSAHCSFTMFSSSSAWDCLKGRWIFFWGDSNHVDTIRNLLNFVLDLPEIPAVPRRFDRNFSNPKNPSQTVRITSIFNGHWNDTQNYEGLNSLRNEGFRSLLQKYFSEETVPDTIIMNSGLHDGVHWLNIRSFSVGATYAASFWKQVLDSIKQRGLTVPKVFYRTTVATGGYARTLAFNPNKMEIFNWVVLEKLKEAGITHGVIDNFDMTFPWHFDNRCNDGVHYGRAPAKLKWRDGEIGHQYFLDLMLAHILLNALCT